jgi:8-oxo-dGTP pyrophosphatase MutT (NUDIX family)
MGNARKKVQVWIVAADGRVLLLRTNAARSLFWQPVTGSVDPGESFEQAAAREAHEETKLEGLSAPTFLDYEFEFESFGATHHEKVFFVRAARDSAECKVQLDPNEHSDSKWVGADEALTLLRFESNREALRRLTASLKPSIIGA